MNVMQEGIPDRWRLQDTVTIPALELEVFIRTEHHPDSCQDKKYDSFAFLNDDKKHWAFSCRYETEEEARKGHQTLIDKILKGQWELVPIQWKLRYVGDENKESKEETEAELFVEIIGDLGRVYESLPNSLQKMFVNMAIQRVKRLKEIHGL